jgi:hypothetical protein
MAITEYKYKLRKAVNSPEPDWVFNKYAPEGECVYCDQMREEKKDSFPNHTAMYFCQSGRYDHCSCDRCF